MEEDIIEEVYTDEDEYFEAVDYLQEHGLYEENYHE